jgi:hypothetical protein
MSDYENLIEDVVERYPHFVVEVSGPWRNPQGQLEDEPWICNFKNRTSRYTNVHAGSGGETMIAALQAGIAYIDAHADDPLLRNYDDNVPVARSPGPK